MTTPQMLRTRILSGITLPLLAFALTACQVPAPLEATPAPAAPEPAAPAPVEAAPVPGAPAPAPAPEAPSRDTAAAAAAAGSALAQLETIAIKGRAPKTGYSRDMFGSAWPDMDGDGCDERNEILQRDLTGITFRDGRCVVATGTLADPYTGTTISFIRGTKTSSAVQIDHVVALSDAWQKGAQQLSAADRLALANDPLNLLAADGPANGSKSDSDAATWLPPNKGFRCEYVARQTSVKAKYGLWMTQAEHDAIARVLAGCPNEPAAHAGPARSTAAAAEVLPAPIQAPAPESGAVAYANCAAVRAAGAAPIRVGDPGYAKKLDRDGDGIGCE
ncbi:GmrSD restriction endonuclease domain-containing protein [Arthrobacter sp. IK3]|uniref:GmrSD restriction endonuclease domain-containing protein n=1 Tax=Arthrobacter sp. IK3 TaxID=3448169 RepID=UPI003EE15768